MKLLRSGGFLNPKQKANGSEIREWMKYCKNTLKFWNPLNEQTAVPTSFWWRYCDLVRKTLLNNFDTIPILVHPLSIYLSNIFKVSKNKQTKSKKKSRRTQLRKGKITNHFNWCEPFEEETVSVKCVILTIQEKWREIEGSLFAGLTEGMGAFVKERTQD